MLLDVVCCLLPQIAQITKKIICENLRNLRPKTQSTGCNNRMAMSTYIKQKKSS